MTVRWGIKEGLFKEVPSKPTDQHEMRAHASQRAREGHNRTGTCKYKCREAGKREKVSSGA